jgi:putative glutamine amidotransferase
MLVLFAGTLGCAMRGIRQVAPETTALRDAALEKSRGPVLLLTDPSEETIKQFLFLVDASLINVENLRIVGIHHASDPLDTARSARLLEERQVTWFSLETVHCELPDDPFVFSPSCLAAFSELFERSDGIVFSGGPDLPAADYQEAQSLLTAPRSLERTRFELALAAALLGGKGWRDGRDALLESRPSYLVLGICLGMQELNVALGGTLHQDIPFEIYGLYTYEEVLAEPRAAHRRYRLGRTTGDLGRFARHRLATTPAWTSRGLPDLDEGSPRVLSAHHQAVEQLGSALEVLATSRDGAVVESLGHTRFRSVLGVQFHPEHEAIAKAALSRGGPSIDEASLAAHRKLWSWISGALIASAEARMGAVPTPTSTPTPAD